MSKLTDRLNASGEGVVDPLTPSTEPRVLGGATPVLATPAAVAAAAAGVAAAGAAGAAGYLAEEAADG
jgi:hypothetical protein